MLFKNINYFDENQQISSQKYMLIENGTISYIGEACPKNYDGRTINGENKLIMPGFVNTHCHVPMTLFRSLGGNMQLNEWLLKFIFPMEDKLTGDFVYYGALTGIAEMIKSGVTSFNDMYYYSENVCDAVSQSGMKANIAMEGLAFDDSLNNRLTCQKEHITDFFHKYNNSFNGRIKIDLSIHSEYTGCPEKIEMIGNMARELKANIQLHLSETENEVTQCIQRHKKTPPQFFNDIGVFDNNVTAAHCVYLNEDDIEILNKKKVNVSHCPLSNLKLGSGICDISRLSENDINVTIGTDGAASNDNLNFIEDVKASALLAKGIHKNAALFSSGDIIKMAYKYGAVSQGRFDTGEISVGK